MMKFRDHVDQSWMIRLLLLLLVVINASSYCYAINNNEFLSMYDCKVGCDLDISVNGDIVCGSDNNVYPNECFAVCQNVKVVKKGPCTADRSRIAVNGFAAAAVQTGFIPIEKIKQYENDGYKMIRRWDYSKLNGQVKMPTITDEILKQMQMNVNSSLKQTSFSYTPSMINSEGYEYIGNGIDFNIDDSIKGVAPQSIAGYNPHLDDPKKYNDTNRSRKLQVLGGDNRTQIRNTDTYPYRVVGALGYTPDNKTCSGTVIYKSAVLTAASCVYDTAMGVWAPLSYFAPGRGKDGIPWNDPYGTWPVDTIIMPSTYDDYENNWVYDYAIVKLFPNSNGQEIGDFLGYVGLDEVSGYDDPDLDRSTITGYPVDLGARTMWTAGTRPKGFVSGSSYGFHSQIALHNLDSTGTGSSVMRLSGVTEYYARGVHVFTTSNPSTFPWHGANVFFQGNGMFDTIMEWSGRGTPSTPGSTPRPIPLVRSKQPSAKPSVKPSKNPSSTPSLMPTPKFSPTDCVTDERELKLSVRNIPNNSLTSTTIEICAKHITLNDKITSDIARYSGINLINQYVKFQCRLANATEKCVIDAQQRSRHFYIYNSTVSFDGIIFVNGNVIQDFISIGGSLWIGFSTMQINQCDFIGCTATSGGAIHTRFSVIEMKNVSSMNNIGGAIQSGTSVITILNGLLTNNSNNYGGAIDSFKSNIAMESVDMTNNIASESGGAVRTELSAISMTNVILANNSALKGTISLFETNINLNKVSFSGATDVDKSDILVSTFNVDDREVRYSKVNLPEQPPQPQTQRTLYFNTHIVSESPCINSCTELIEGVENCKMTSSRCNIYVCSKNISCSRTMFANKNPLEYGIDVSNKDIIFHCLLTTSTERCILDGSRNTRLFYGSNTNVEFHNFIFAHGNDSTLGGGMKIQNNSVVKLLDCTFLRCSSPSGSAVSLSNTKFVMEGTMASIINNTGSQTSLEFFSSDIELYNIKFSGNDVSSLYSEILIYDSTIKAASLSFDMNNNKNDCKIFVAIHLKDFTKQSSCIAMGSISNARTTNPKSLSQELITKQSDRSSSCLSFSTPIIVSQPSPIKSPPLSTPPYDTRGPISPPVTIPVPAESPTPSTDPPAPVSPPVIIPVPTESPTTIKPIPSPSCLSGDNLVYVKNIGYKRLDEVKIGDYIKSSNGDFTQIYGFGHMDPYQESEFLQIHYQLDTIPVFSYLEVSPKHLVSMDQNNQTNMIRSSYVVIGNKLSGMIVEKIEIVVRQGLYAPLTYSGDFMVNGVIVSNYVDVLDHGWTRCQHTMGHILFLPQRIFCTYFMEICKKEKYIDGYGYLAYIIIRVSSYVQQSLLFVNNMILIVTIGFVACVFAFILYLSY